MTHTSKAPEFWCKFPLGKIAEYFTKLENAYKKAIERIENLEEEVEKLKKKKQRITNIRDLQTGGL